MYANKIEKEICEENTQLLNLIKISIYISINVFTSDNNQITYEIQYIGHGLLADNIHFFKQHSRITTPMLFIDIIMTEKYCIPYHWMIGFNG